MHRRRWCKHGIHACKSLSFFLLLWAFQAPAVERGGIAPDFTLPLLANSPSSENAATGADSGLYPLVQLSDYRGQVIYLDFWHSACAPCRVSLPLLDTLYNEFKRGDFEILSISTDALPQEALDLIETLGVSYPIASDPAGRIAELYQLENLPTAYLIARDGRVEAVHRGFRFEDLHDLRAALKALSSN